MLQIVANNNAIPPEHIFIKWIDILSQIINIKEENIILRVVEKAESQSLNNQFRCKNYPTNVLSFPSQLPKFIDDQYLGDIVICADIVEREASAQNKSTEAHWAHMLVHGILHLQGYDHIKDKQAREMECLEINLLAELGYPNPYEA